MSVSNECGKYKDYIDVGGDVKRLSDELLTLCSQLEALNENVNPIRHKIEMLSKSAVEQIKEKKEANEMLLADLNSQRQSSSILPQLAPTEVTMMEPDSPCEEPSTVTEVTNMSRPTY